MKMKYTTRPFYRAKYVFGPHGGGDKYNFNET